MTFSVGIVRNHTPLHFGNTSGSGKNVTYLGIDIKNNGNFKNAIASRIA